jgi:squalene cyclase
MKTLLFIALAFGLGVRGFADEAIPDPAQTVPKALQYLVEKGNDWMDDQSCAACHHLPMMIWSLREAKAGGFAVDEKALAKAIEWALSPKVDGKAFAVDKEGKEQFSLPTTYLTLALTGKEGVPPEWSARALANALGSQQPDGMWTLGGGGRSPISSEKSTQISLIVALALSSGAKTDAAAAAQEKVLGWLAAQPADDETQYHALRLLLDARLGRSPAKESIEWLRARQNADGGWGQFKDAPSDAHATGQAVYALTAAGLAGSDAAIQHARDFLTRTQAADGSWPMTSRPNGPGKGGAKNLEPIIYTSTAWAVMALARSQPHP